MPDDSELAPATREIEEEEAASAARCARIIFRVAMILSSCVSSDVVEFLDDVEFERDNGVVMSDDAEIEEAAPLLEEGS